MAPLAPMDTPMSERQNDVQNIKHHLNYIMRVDIE